jgi:hypothetical protein
MDSKFLPCVFPTLPASHSFAYHCSKVLSTCVSPWIVNSWGGRNSVFCLSYTDRTELVCKTQKSRCNEEQWGRKGKREGEREEWQKVVEVGRESIWIKGTRHADINKELTIYPTYLFHYVFMTSLWNRNYYLYSRWGRQASESLSTARILKAMKIWDQGLKTNLPNPQTYALLWPWGPSHISNNHGTDREKCQIITLYATVSISQAGLILSCCSLPWTVGWNRNKLKTKPLAYFC